MAGPLRELIHADLVAIAEGQPLSTKRVLPSRAAHARRRTTGPVVRGELVPGKRLKLQQNVTLGDRRLLGGQPDHGDVVASGTGAFVLGPVTLGRGVVVAPNGVVLDDVPSECLVGGIPARVLRCLAPSANAD